MIDQDIDTTTPATDKECLEIEAKARTRKVMHWPELVRVINRMRAAERRAEAAERAQAYAEDALLRCNKYAREQADRAEAAEKERDEFRAALDRGPAASVEAQAEINHWRERVEELEAVLKEVEQTTTPYDEAHRIARAMREAKP